MILVATIGLRCDISESAYVKYEGATVRVLGIVVLTGVFFVNIFASIFFFVDNLANNLFVDDSVGMSARALAGLLTDMLFLTRASMVALVYFIDINFISCGDTNTQPNTSFGTRVWVQQSTGKWFGRPRVKAGFVNSQGHQWLLAKVPVGGYLDQMFMRVENGDMVVFIRHKSLDSKPDASVWYRYVKKS